MGFGRYAPLLAGWMQKIFIKMAENIDNQIGGYIPGEVSVRCFCCNKKYYASARSFQCKPCAEKMVVEFDALFPQEQEQRLKDAEEYLSGITINRVLNF